MFLNPIDDLDSLGEPNIRKRLGILDRLIVNFPSGRKSHLTMHRQGQHLGIICRLFVEQIEFILKRIKDVPSRDASAIHARIIESADRVFVRHDNHRLALDVPHQREADADLAADHAARLADGEIFRRADPHSL